jgi:TonB family protein
MAMKSATFAVRQADRGFGRASLCLSLVLVLIATTVCSPGAAAQTVEKSNRKILVTVKPEYPQTLQHAQIGGLVRLSATVLANGTVSKVQIRGGNPVLAECAAAAVMKWKYAPAPSETNEEVSVSFSPH